MSDQSRLAGLRLALSVSNSPDLDRMGLTETHLRLVLGEVARMVLGQGGTLAYGGSLAPGGYTGLLEEEVLRHGARPERLLLLFIPWSEHRSVPLSALRGRQRALGRFGRMLFLDREGGETAPEEGRGEAAVPEADPAMVASSLTAMRRAMTRRTDARLLLGGRRSGFLGAMPGVMEEASLAIDAAEARPLYVAGGFGGVAFDIARAVGLLDAAFLPVRASDPAADHRVAEAARRIAASWPGAAPNGLSAGEAGRLAASHRPGEIAALVALGLGRLGGSVPRVPS